MIEVIKGMPSHVAAFRATGTVSGKDYREIINPFVKKVAEDTGKICYMLILKTELKNYTLGAWVADGFLGLRHFSKWKKLAIVTDKKSIRNFTNTFGFLIPCPTKGYLMEDLEKATRWVSEG
jgi:SpoIIAA-like